MSIVYAGLGKESDFTDKNVNGKLVLLERGEITFDEKTKNAAKAGAQAVIVYNNVEGEIEAYLSEGTLTFGELSNTKTEGGSY